MKSPVAMAGKGAIRVLLMASIVCLLFYAFRMYQLGEIVFSYLPWNLFLAWLPLLLMVFLVRLLRTHAWSSWPALLTTLAWILFLPNSFYMVSDYIHLQELTAENILFDVVLFTMFVATGMILGYCSLFLFHVELLKRINRITAAKVIAVILAVCSFAIYLGRDLRWNSWDVFLHPQGLLFDLSNQILHPFAYGDMVSTVLLFFALTGGLYYVGWRLVGVALQYASRRA